MQIRHDEKKHSFIATSDSGELMGTIIYAPKDGNSIYATHTVVEDKFQGHGVGGFLLNAMVEHARNEGYCIIPLCSFVIDAFKRHPAKYSDVMAEEE